MRRLARFGFEIERLSADHAAQTGGARQQQHQIGAHGRVRMGRRVGEHVKRIGQQAVAGQDRGGFIKGLVAGRTSPTQIVVVHRRQIVMYQRIAMNHLQSTSCAQNAVALDAEQAGGFDQQEGAQALAAAERAIAHGFQQPLRPGFFAGQQMWAEQGIQHGLGRVSGGDETGRKFVAQFFSRHGFSLLAGSSPAKRLFRA